MKRNWQQMRAAGVDVRPLRIIEQPAATETTGRSAFLPVVLVCVFVFVSVGLQRTGFDWIGAGKVTAGFGAFLCALWGMGDWLAANTRKSITEEYAPPPDPVPSVQAQTAEQGDSAPEPWRPTVRDARDFVRDALICINGVWQERDGGATWRAMADRGWTRERWEATRDWLIANGFMRWKSELIHNLGTEWNMDMLGRWLRHGRE